MIVFVHLLNDRSGSPKVLASAIEALASRGTPCRLFVGSEGEGWLDKSTVPATKYPYRRSRYRIFTLLAYVLSQIALLARLLTSRGIPRDAVIYVNTLLPFGGAVFGYVTGRRVIYHLHEISLSPAPLRWFLMRVARYTASTFIYVSEFHRASLPLSDRSAITVYNTLDAAFLAKASASRYQHHHGGVFRVLMLASLRDYKGIPEYVQLAMAFRHRDDIIFDLVVNDDQRSIDRYFEARERPARLTVHPRVGDPVPFYRTASLVVNLSRPDQWIETFGLTVLEAMAFGIPVIAPPVGGPTELVSHGREGFLIDSRDAPGLAETVARMAQDAQLCGTLSKNARSRAAAFGRELFINGIEAAVSGTERHHG